MQEANIPFNGSGVYVGPALPGSWNPATTGSSATPADWNTLLADLSTALSTTITKDGQTTITTDIPFATHKITGLGNGTAAQDAVAFNQLTSGVNGWSTFGAQDVSGVSVIDFIDIPSTANHLQCMVDLQTGTNGQAISLQTYGADGILDVGASDYYWNVFTINTLGASSVTQQTGSLISMTATGISNTTAAFGGDFIATNIQGLTFTKFNFRNNFQNTGSGFGSFGYGARLEADRITGVRISVASGTFAGRATLLVCA